MIRIELFVAFSFAVIFNTGISLPTSSEDESSEAQTETAPVPSEHAAASSGTESVEKYCVENIEKDKMILLQQIRDAKDWALANGLTFPVPKRQIQCDGCAKQLENVVLDDMAQLVPFSLYPSPFPRDLFQEALSVHKAFQLLYFRAMLPSNFDFVKDVHRNVMEVDESLRVDAAYIGHFYKNRRQSLILYCNRADYFASEVADKATGRPKYELKQVEMNAGVIGGYGAPPRVSALHHRMLTNAGIDTSSAPVNKTHVMVATALHKAWLTFGKSEAVVLFLHADSRNFLLVESRIVQHQLERISNFKTKCFFLTLAEGVKRLKLNPNSHSLILDGKFEVAVSASRNSFPKNAAERRVDEAIRQSTAIQLNPRVVIFSHSKKMQQALSNPGVVERLLNGPGEEHLVAAVRKVLAKSWSISQKETDSAEVIRMVRERPENFVMKWNECTSLSKINNNEFIFFGEEIARKLATLTREQSDTYFIMERLQPMVAKNHFVRAHMAPLLDVDATAELGIHGCLLGNLADGTVLDQFWPDFQMRTKLASVDEGGVMKGSSVVDSLYLV